MGKLELKPTDLPSSHLPPPHDVPEAWLGMLEQLLDGVAHQLSNRVALLAGVSEILGRDESIPPILRALADEVPVLEETIRLLRLLATPANEAADPAIVAQLVADARALAVLHPQVKGVTFVVEGAETVTPVVVPPTGFTREIVRALVAGALVRPNADVVVQVTEHGDHVRIQVSGVDQPVLGVTLAAARRAVTS